MTDLEKLTNLLTEFGITFKKSVDPSFTEVICAVPWFNTKTKIKGYSGFYTSFEFDNNGNFETMGIWE